MTPLRFEQLYDAEWSELERLLDVVLDRKTDPEMPSARVPGDRVAALYRRACEHLAIARARAYPAYLLDRLERLTADAHQAIYQQREFGLTRVVHAATVQFPRAVREHARYVGVAAAAFLLPALLLGPFVYRFPELILSVVTPEMASEFEQMYSPAAESIGRNRTAETDWIMFGFYIRNNIGVAFQCFAGGLFAGVGSLFFLAYNGAFFGAIAGYVIDRGLSQTFFSFVATHAAFEITAAILSGAAGLRIGHALLAPGRLTRSRALVQAARDTAILLYGITVMLLLAAAVEAFWSSASWVAPAVKYGAAAMCWTAVLAYFTFQGRRAG